SRTGGAGDDHLAEVNGDRSRLTRAHADGITGLLKEAQTVSAFELPLLIFIAEVCVVSASTLRIIFTSRGHTVLAPMLGMVEITTWLFAIGKTMQNLDNFTFSLAFALGFTLGRSLRTLSRPWL